MYKEIFKNNMLWFMVKIKEIIVVKLFELKSKWKSSDKNREIVFMVVFYL